MKPTPAGKNLTELVQTGINRWSQSLCLERTPLERMDATASVRPLSLDSPGMLRCDARL